MRGVPTSAISSSRYSSRSDSSASCSCSRQRLRRARLVDQSDSSKAWRADVDGPLHVLGRGVGHLAEHLLGRRIDVLEPLARGGLDELAADEHAHLTGTALVGHAAPLPLSNPADRRDYEAPARPVKAATWAPLPPGDTWPLVRREEILRRPCRFRAGPFDALPE